MRVLLTGGGTGGHIYPALSLANHIKKQVPQTEFLYVGTSKGLEADIVPKAGMPMMHVEVSGFKRSLSLTNFKTVYQFLAACRKAKQIIQTFKPDVVVGTGGYVSGPIVYTASRMGLPTMIHEQNAIPGLTNKFLSRFIDVVAVSFPESLEQFPKAKKVVLTGNPRATEVIHADPQKGVESLGLSSILPLVIVVGGSRGARAINEAVEGWLTTDIDLPFQVLFVTGSVHFDKINKTQKAVDISKNVIRLPFVYNMPEVLASADLVIARAGATFLAEITSLGVPSILIPSPHVTNNHQYHNAKALENAGAAIVIEEKGLTAQRLKQKVYELVGNDQRIAQLKVSAKKLGLPEAADRMTYEILKLVRKA
ncbi:undecaprenyldiphospho-muramoylpentapeptide beta-N-acetylglucosaminyltransferase [Desulfuribacillus stibiiarsenatis]|uniref:UDP-N-acetylglucosamine--N-acetylmuramyl-(pentapeptide) pyrophosphoryl-undecaprenol N-acetylglucosamine transferase n=1 Tax=Desulfuribacillus stibiiarsenatis TaxID=1390249 RepID=A0A1E5L3L2_9FIRM|nr:undecaprenyldiphospho-muramoylpentapeptide beta-N-acetylglucosaminyltransferase [Desulfuribacillus stibiiarsenatis]OEH84712.1 undecaprenyldiphospho-muramoylpentapeptide beta-N-acetylglucosaminyltransferase [Desulfuribacillus stibiiarsenatis]